MKATMRSWLKKLREQKSLSQTKMAELLGISRQSYNFIENYERQTQQKKRGQMPAILKARETLDKGY